MANIRVTPETLSTQGKDLIGYAGELKDVLSSIDGKINEIGRSGAGCVFRYVYADETEPGSVPGAG